MPFPFEDPQELNTRSAVTSSQQQGSLDRSKTVPSVSQPPLFGTINGQCIAEGLFASERLHIYPPIMAMEQCRFRRPAASVGTLELRRGEPESALSVYYLLVVGLLPLVAGAVAG